MDERLTYVVGRMTVWKDIGRSLEKISAIPSFPSRDLPEAFLSGVSVGVRSGVWGTTQRQVLLPYFDGGGTIGPDLSIVASHLY